MFGFYCIIINNMADVVFAYYAYCNLAAYLLNGNSF